MRIALLRRTRNDRRQKILMLQHRCLVLRNHPLRHALRFPPLLGPQHKQTLQKNNDGRIRITQNVNPQFQINPKTNPKYKSRYPPQNKPNQIE